MQIAPSTICPLPLLAEMSSRSGHDSLRLRQWCEMLQLQDVTDVQSLVSGCRMKAGW
jgi:hypothetical protein